MRNYIKSYVVSLGIIISSVTYAQTSSITIEASQNVTNFIFTDSEGHKDSGYSPVYSGGYALGYQFMMEEGIIFPVKLGMRKSGATYVLDETNYEWEFDYAEFRLGVGYNHNISKFNIHFITQGYAGFLLKANQRLNNENFDIKESGDIEKNDLGLIFSPGGSFTVNEYISVYLDVNYLLGLKNLETEGSQTSKNTMVGGTLGLAFTIK